MNYKISGLSSIFFLFIAISIAGYQLLVSSPIIGIIYAVFIPVAFLIVLYFYCRKCPHTIDKTCRHVIFGLIVEKIYKPIKPSPYTSGEIFMVLMPLAIYVVFPQYWLLQNTYLLVTFWGFILMAGLTIKVGVCPQCRNKNCSFCFERNKGETK